MTSQWDKLGTLAEKLELSNALRKQAERELRAERVEHGKTKAYVAELEHKLRAPAPTPPENTPKQSPEERLALRRDTIIGAAHEQNNRLRAMLNECRKSNKKLIEELNKVS
jgi:hypothetical protein